jgi:hypothetical protein
MSNYITCGCFCKPHSYSPEQIIAWNCYVKNHAVGPYLESHLHTAVLPKSILILYSHLLQAVFSLKISHHRPM